MSKRSPKELIELYWTEVWNNRNAEMIRELCADPILRHDANSVTALSIEDQIARVRQQSEKAEPYFEHEVLHADDTYVTSVWNMHTRKGGRVDLCGIEIFKAKDGKFTDCWNSTYVPGRWGREGDAAVPKDLPPPEHIMSSSQITPSWMQKVLHAANVDAARVSMTNIEPIGHGNLSETVRVPIIYNANAADQINSVICKLSSTHPMATQIDAIFGVYGREAETYKTLSNSPDVNAPRAYFVGLNTAGDSLNLVLEDLSGKTRAGDQISGCNEKDALATIDSLAGLHAKYWGKDELKNAPWLFARKDKGKLQEESFHTSTTLFRQRFDGKIAPEYLEKMDRFKGHVERWTKDNVFSRTLIHGEPRVDNILFEDADEGVKAWMIDWQFTDFGSPMFDTAYFLAGSMNAQDRKKHEEQFIARQQTAIAKVDPAYTLEIARHEYAASLPFALFTTVGAVGAVPEGEHGDNLLIALLTRNIDALDHWNAYPAA